MEDVVIRRAAKHDLPFVVSLWREMMDHHLAIDPRFELAPGNEAAYLDYLYSIVENYDYAIFMAVHGDDVIGYVIGMILSNPPVFALTRYGFIAEMSVRAEHRRHGAGRLLWEHSRRWFKRRGIEVIQLNVSPRNKGGYQFWKDAGCEEFLHIMWHDIPKSI